MFHRYNCNFGWLCRCEILVIPKSISGVLSKTAGLFARRGFNIDSLAVGETEDTLTSSMTIVSTGDERTLGLILSISAG